ncbi:MAG: hypothetical protein NVS2B7_23710 [Herpetosiphon sp.]
MHTFWQHAATDQLVAIASEAQSTVVLIKSGNRGVGSGVVWTNDGLIITNYHVLADETLVQIIWQDNRQAVATVVASDPTLDLGILRVDARDVAASVPRQTDHIRVGELVMAIGNPRGQRGVVTLGIVSGIGEIKVPWRTTAASFIRSDVQLAPGNSGGPLLDMRGQVVGINAMIMGGDLSVAIPSSVVTQYLHQINSCPSVGVGVRTVALPYQLPRGGGRTGTSME